MVYQRDSESLRTRLHQAPDTVRARGSLEDALARMNDPQDMKQRLNLVIYSQVQPVALAEEQSAIIGRSDSQTGFVPDVDLMRYNARKHGVSREHACIYLRGGHFYLMDLGSNNGTYMNSRALMPHTPQIIQQGDVIRFGLLEIQIDLP